MEYECNALSNARNNARNNARKRIMHTPYKREYNDGI